MNKRDTLKDPNSCFSKAAPDEEIFVIRAKDPLGAQIVRLWAAMAFPEHEKAKIASAIAIADQMERWRQTQASKDAEDMPSYLKPI